MSAKTKSEKTTTPTPESASEKGTNDARIQKILAVKKVVNERNKARQDLNFDRSDFLRDKLLNDHGVDVIDQKSGPSGWKFKDGSSTKMPAGSTVPKEYIESCKETKPKRGLEKESESSDTNKKRKKDSNSNSNSTGNQERGTREAKKEKTKEQGKETDRNSALLNLLNPTNTAVRNIQGVLVEETVTGKGAVVKNGARVKVHYIGKLKTTGNVFDSSLKKPFTFRVGKGEVIRGWDIGLMGMAVGSKRTLTIPPEKAYGKSGSPPVIPSNATLVFDIMLLATG